MTFGAFERSVEDGSPIELYQFSMGSSTFNFTSNARPVQVSEATYQPLEISRERVEINPEERAETLKVIMPSSTPLVRQFINNVPGQRVDLIIRRLHRRDGAMDTIQVFEGSVRAVSFTLNGLNAEIAVMPLSGDLLDGVPRFKFSRVCNNVLYDPRCKVVEADHSHIGPVTSVDGAEITVAGLEARSGGDATWAVAGFVQFDTDFRMILAQNGDTLRLLVPFPVSPLGSSVEVRAGCDHSIETCNNKFGNGENFGGYAFVPLRNPFGSGGINV